MASPARWFGALACAGSMLLSAGAVRADADPPRWCAPELEALAEGVCYQQHSWSAARPAPDPAQQTNAPQRGDSKSKGAATAVVAPKVLVIFLHSLVGNQASWQWQQQRMLARSGERLGFSVLMPRGRLGIGPGRAPDVWAWPTSPAMREQHEAQIIEEWLGYKRVIEQRDGRFDQVFIFGFSNGAYYAASLALRGELPVQGYGVFAGGSGSKYLRLMGARATTRAPVFVGYGTKDPAHRSQRALVRLLADLGWRHRAKSAPVGHLVTDSQLAAAVRFLLNPGA